ncbi:MAG: MFS transporter [Prolixibacteraceae bacterium]
MQRHLRNLQYYKFSAYGFLRNLRFFDSFLLLFLLEKGMSYSQIGVLYAVKEVALNLFEIPSGIIADGLGRKKSLATSFVAFIASFIVFYFSSNFWLFLLAFAVFGLADAFRTGTHKGMMMDYLKLKGWSEHKTAYYGNTRSWSQIGLAVSALFAGTIVLFTGTYRSIFIYSVVPYLLNLVLLLTYPAVLDKSLQRKSNSASGKLLEAGREFVLILKRPQVLKLISSSAAHTAFQKSVKDYIQPAMVLAISTLPFFAGSDEKQKNGWYIGIIYFVIYLFTSRSSKLAGWVKEEKRRSVAKLTLLVGLGAGVLCGSLLVWNFAWFSVLAFALIFMVENFRKPIMTGLVADVVPTSILASVLSAQSQLRTVLSVFISIGIGVLADLFGVGIGLLMVSLTLLLFYFILGVFRYPKKLQ